MLCCFLFLFQLGNSQDALLTKDETINYINRVLKRSVGHNAAWLGCEESKRGEIVTSSFTKEGENVVYHMESKAYDDGWCRSNAQSYKYYFNPAHIKEIKLVPIKGLSVAYVEITLIKSDLLRFYSNGQKSNRNKITMYLLVPDNKTFETFKKALNHLKDLVNAEEDPFGNG